MNIKPTYKTIACIAVRMKSKRLKRKALLEIEGKPMTLCLIERLRMSKSIEQIVICTSTNEQDRILLDLAKEWQVDALAGSESDVLSDMAL